MAIQVEASAEAAKRVVLALGDAINAEDFQLARKYVSKDLKHVGPFGSHDNSEAYFEEMERLRLKFKVHRAFADRNDVCLFYDVTAFGTTTFTSAWFQVKDGKVSSMRVVFDTAPLLAARAASR